VTKQVVVTYTCDNCGKIATSDTPKYLPWDWRSFQMEAKSWVGRREGPYEFIACEECAKGSKPSIFRLLFARLARGKKGT
jgi:hypothetical protein